MTPAQIYRRSLQIKSKLESWNQKYRELQSVCPHIRASKTAKADTGNWDRGQDSYWYEFYCPDCDKRWTETQ